MIIVRVEGGGDSKHDLNDNKIRGILGQYKTFIQEKRFPLN